jgi:hypothetical protein
MAPTPFGAVLDRHLEASDLSLRAFARLAGVPVSLLSRVKSGERAVPTERITAWADLLNLRGPDREEFIDAAMWTAVPVRVRPWLEGKLGIGGTRKR